MSTRTVTAGLVLAAVSAIAAPAAADERPPRFDDDSLCNRLATSPEGVSPESKAACLSAQGDALDAVRRVWTNIPTDIQDNCVVQAKVDRDGDYLILEACIRAQMRQQEANQVPVTRSKAKAKP